jgi:polyphosphate glucokinase
MKGLGIDVGGSGIKGAIVDLKTGRLLTERYRITTPQPATPGAVAKTIALITTKFHWKKRIGVGFPAAVKKNIILTASNIDDSWIGTDGAKVIGDAAGNKVTLINDADAAAIAECRYGSLKIDKGVVIFVTVGTGLGTAILNDGVLLPNTELGHVHLKKHGIGERYASDAARSRNHQSWKDWGKRLNRYLEELDFLLRPDMFVIGGGVSNTPELFIDCLILKTPVHMASLKNEAGIVGAALAALMAKGD